MQNILRALRLLCFLSLFALVSLAEEAPKITMGILAQMTDTQIGFDNFDEEYNRLHNTINILNDGNLQCAIFCGDMIHNAYNKEHVEALMKELARIKKPYFLVCGNHDDPQFFRDHFGPTYYAADLPFEGYRLIVLDTNLWSPNILPESEKMEAMLQEELKNAQAAGKKVIVAGHCPIFYKTFDEEIGHDNLPMEKRILLEKLFLEYPVVVAYLAGHSHTTFTALWHGILLSNSETTSVAFDKINYGFRRFFLESDGTIRFNTVLVPTTLKKE